MHQAFFRRLGFEPVFIDIKDMVPAVADGSVDAQENPLTNIVNFGLQRYHRFVSLTAHMFGVALLLINRERFDGWPAECRLRFMPAASDATAGSASRRRSRGRSLLPPANRRRRRDRSRPASLDRAAFVRAAG